MAFLVTAALVLAAAFFPWTAVSVGLLLAVLVAMTLSLRSGSTVTSPGGSLQ